MPWVSADAATRENDILWITVKTMEVVAADIFMINNKMLLYIVDYYSKFSIVEKVGSLAADDQNDISRIWTP